MKLREIYGKLYDLLDPRERRLSLLVLGFMLIVALFDMVGVASILPFVAVLSNPDFVQENAYLRQVYELLGFETTDDFLFWLGAGALALLLTSLLFRALGLWVRIRFTNGRNHALSARMIAKYMAQPYPWFLDRHSARLGNTILGEVGQVIGGALNPAIQLIANAAIAFLLFLLLIVVDPVLAIAATLVLGTAYAGTFFSVQQHLTRLGREQQRAQQLRFKVAQEGFGAIKDVKINGLETSFVRLYSIPSAKLARINATQGLISQIPAFALQGLIFGGMMVVILYLMRTRDNLEAALPTLALYAFAGYRLMPTLQALYSDFARLRTTLPLLESLHTDYHLLESSALTSEEPAPLGINQSLELRNVRYTYPNADRPSLVDLSLVIPVRTTVGLVGSTGSGKTTTVDMILGLLTPDSGALCVDGRTLSDRELRAWQRTLGYVPQHIFLTEDSIAQNIAFGLPPEQIDMTAVERAARVANLHDFIVNELPKGYNTDIGEWGVRLSGGQRQRVGIARALYHDPEVIIMDEATSALDNLTEEAVMDAVHNLGREKTIILVAHRLSTVRNCETIFMLDHGVLASSGTFEELVERNSKFRAMARLIK